ncbi:MAG TPA: outer membrane beta-barrel protein [Terriglobales bacterium]|nr:outer membrane beta-barrel protein [Terriglobales bacterium]
MKVVFWMSVAIFSLCLAFVVAPLCRAQGQAGAAQTSSPDMSQRVQELERQINELRSELAAIKQGGASATTASSTPTPTPPQNNLAPTSGSATVTPAGPSLAGLLGPTTLSGFVDTYYGQNFNNPASRNNMLRAFDLSTNQFGLNLVELVADKQPDANNSRTGYHIALGFGQAMNVVNGTDPGGLGFGQYLKEAYFSYLAPVGKGLQVDVGKFVTPHGAEVIETKDNWNYSRGLLFTYAIPFYHFGMRAKYTFNDKYAVTGYLVNGWNDVVDNNTGKTYGATFAWNPNKKFGIAQNYMAGPEQTDINSNWRQLSDTVVTYSPTGRLSFMVNYDYARGDRIPTVLKPVYWTGAAGYVRYLLNATNALATRYEYYDDKYGVTTGGFLNPTPQHLHEFTETYEHLLAHHILTRFEFRRDMSNQPSFLKGTTPVMTQNTATAGFVFMFDSREAK